MASQPAHPSLLPADWGADLPGESFYIHTRGVRLHAVSHGSPDQPLVLFLHGLGGGWFDWMPLFHQLRHDPLHLVALDMRGSGLSDKTPSGYDLTSLASDISGTIRSLGVQKAVVVTHGENSHVAWTVLTQNPQQIQALVTLSGSHPVVARRRVMKHPWEQRRYLREELLAQIPVLPRKFLASPRMHMVYSHFLNSLSPAHKTRDDMQVYAQLHQLALQDPKIAKSAIKYRDWSFKSRLYREDKLYKKMFQRRSQVPVSILVGQDDPYAVAATAQASAHRGNKDSFVRYLTGVGHFPHLEDPTLVADVIRSHTRRSQSE